MSEFLVACYATLHPTLFVCPSVGLSLSVCHIYLFIFLCFDLTAPHATGVAMYLASYFDRNRIIFIVHFSKLGLSELESLKSQPLQKFIQKSLLMKEYKKRRNKCRIDFEIISTVMELASAFIQDKKTYRNGFISKFISFIQKLAYGNKFLDWEGLKRQGFKGGFSPQKKDTFLSLFFETNSHLCNIS